MNPRRDYTRLYEVIHDDEASQPGEIMNEDRVIPTEVDMNPRIGSE